MTRNYTAELEAARNAQDWVAHARIWEERRVADVASDEAQLATFVPSFPGYPVADLPALPAGFTDTSWGNDTCPSYQSRALCLHIFLDFVDPAERELNNGARFIVYPVDEEGCLGTDAALLQTDDWSEVLAFIAARTVQS